MSNRRNPLSYRYGYSISWPHTCYYGCKNTGIVLLHKILAKYVNCDIVNYNVEINKSKTIKIKFFIVKPIAKLKKNVVQLSNEINQLYRQAVRDYNKNSLYDKIDSDIKVSIDIKQAAVNSAHRMAKFIEEKTLERQNIRTSVSKVLKSAIDDGVQGIKIIIKGRLGGAEMSSVEKFIEGRMPLSSIKAVIDYAQVDIKMPYGVIGVKVFLYLHNTSSVMNKALH